MPFPEDPATLAGMIECAELDAVAVQVKRGEKPEHSVRALLSWFGAERRGSEIAFRIRRALRERDLRTNPDFTEVYIDASIAFEDRRVTDAIKPPGAPPGNPIQSDSAPVLSSESPDDSGEPSAKSDFDDPVLRIGNIPAANKPVITVPAGTPLADAMTVMLLHDFSQLPVVQNVANCKGAVSLGSIARAIHLGRNPVTVDDCLTEHYEEVSGKATVFATVSKIVMCGFVVVRDAKRGIQGIVTLGDLSMEFHSRSEPFLLLGEIESQLRRVIVSAGFTRSDFVKVSRDEGRPIESVLSLTFGEYVALLESRENWARLETHHARDPFMKELRMVNRVRNKVMHFAPDPMGADQLEALRSFARFMQLL